jgi:hypothetical protein
MRDETLCISLFGSRRAVDGPGRSARGRALPRGISSARRLFIPCAGVNSAPMTVTTALDALEKARARGFIEAVFAPGEPDGVPKEDNGGGTCDFGLWGEECDAAGRHVVVVGQLPEAHLVMVVLRSGAPDMGYALEELREVLVRYFDAAPLVNADVPDEEAWTSPLTSREKAIAVARELVEVDSRERDPDVELAYEIMTC